MLVYKQYVDHLFANVCSVARMCSLTRMCSLRLVYKQYVDHLFATRPSLTDSERFEQPYWDYLQVRFMSYILG